MQRPPYGNQGFQGGPMQPGPPGGPGFNNPGGPQYAPGYGQPPYGAPAGPQQNQANPGCFMPAATIRKISNTTPPQFHNNNRL